MCDAAGAKHGAQRSRFLQGHNLLAMPLQDQRMATRSRTYIKHCAPTTTKSLQFGMIHLRFVAEKMIGAHRLILMTINEKLNFLGSSVEKTRSNCTS